jgi:hypothetical protein
MVITGVVNNFIEGETVEQKGKNKQREERERKMAAEAELEKLVDKDWRERMATYPLSFVALDMGPCFAVADWGLQVG